MTQTFTPNDVVRYTYGESTEAESTAITTAMAHDEALRAEVQDFDMLRREMDKISMAPRYSTVEKLLFFSANYEVKA